MRTIQLSVLTLAGAALCFGQHWEIGGSAGAGFLPQHSITSAFAPADAGFQTGFSAGAFVGQNLYPHWSGEIHYGYLQSNLRLASGGTVATFTGQSHVVHYDMIFHTNRQDRRAQYFAAFGGGMKVFRGTGKESAYQPLSQYGYFTKTQVVKPMASVGAGIKVALRPHMFLRTEIRDYITMFPKEVLTPAPGATFGGLLHDFVPSVGISYEY
jgi:hypothetical protein